MISWLVLTAALVSGFAAGRLWTKRLYDLEKERALRKSAEAAASLAIRVEEEVRRTARELEKCSSDTLADTGSRLLSGNDAS